jgi:uncharacterized damage-inducible protein DinB
MKRTEWFKRVFPPILDNGLFPCILERLEGTAVRLRHKISKMTGDLTAAQQGTWSIHKEVGHLIDLEPLWHERMLQIIGDETNLKIADLTNQKTHTTNHDAVNIYDLITQFEAEREKLLITLRRITDQNLDKAAVHPRLGTPMKLIDLAFFVAEHDDHHLAQITFLGKQTNS